MLNNIWFDYLLYRSFWTISYLYRLKLIDCCQKKSSLQKTVRQNGFFLKIIPIVTYSWSLHATYNQTSKKTTCKRKLKYTTNENVSYHQMKSWELQTENPNMNVIIYHTGCLLYLRKWNPKDLGSIYILILGRLVVEKCPWDESYTSWCGKYWGNMAKHQRRKADGRNNDRANLQQRNMKDREKGQPTRPVIKPPSPLHESSIGFPSMSPPTMRFCYGIHIQPRSIYYGHLCYIA